MKINFLILLSTEKQLNLGLAVSSFFSKLLFEILKVTDKLELEILLTLEVLARFQNVLSKKTSHPAGLKITLMVSNKQKN